MKSKLLTASLVLACLVGCATGASVSTPTPTVTSDIVECSHSKDKSLNFSYNKSSVEVWKSAEYGVDVYQITTVNGKIVNLNTYEIMNFTCEG